MNDQLQDAYRTWHKAKAVAERARRLPVSDEVKKPLVESAQQRLEVVGAFVEALEKANKLWEEITQEPERAINNQEYKIHTLINYIKYPTDDYFKKPFDELSKKELEYIESDLLKLVVDALSPTDSRIDLVYFDKLTEFAVDYLASKGLPTLKQILEEPSVKAALAEIRAMKEAEKTAERLV